MSSAAYSVHPTPIGQALIVTTDAGLAALHLLDGPHDAALAGIGLALHAVPREDPAATAAVAAQLDEYFAGDRRAFDLPIDWWFAEGFTRRALESVQSVPYGQTASYGEIAVLAGSPGAHRAVGSACARTAISIVVPAHRVVRADGSIGEYGGHPEVKRFLLDLEDRVAAGV
ncbi:methylated-DNA--[protein]-cysteine S-methyltransferase [Microbacterium sp. W1N]|uniref:methylated-DNA--[protein]-cysteine S-methyltransferase n=1 Tax=Microbacterium festucae TaxID=2977531 RepID=UPI0021C10CB5|nr:methylated-DNA--[protein]-cysteine S-methyltransferase [Microbacterium festucae]MCT9821147.1 methylated-DNA--[protein]-cysteine S-methyltransferase [Microbacterium festucae]